MRARHQGKVRRPVTVTLSDISQAFNDLISGSRSREEVASWADALRRLHDDDQLQFEPDKEKCRIWGAILYLMGVDLKNSPTEYLHCTEDFLCYRQGAGV